MPRLLSAQLSCPRHNRGAQSAAHMVAVGTRRMLASAVRSPQHRGMSGAVAV